MKTVILLQVGRPHFQTPDAGEEQSIDVVLVVDPKDFSVLTLLVQSLTKIQQHINKVFVVAPKSDKIIEFCNVNDISFTDEVSVLGYGKECIHYVSNGKDRSGWLYQQLLKLHADTFVESKKYLVVDADTVFVSPTSFIQDGKDVLFETDREWHPPYFKAMGNLLGPAPRNNLSFVAHMMLFDVHKVQELREEVERLHGKRFDEVVMGTPRLHTDEKSCFSEFELYGNWMLNNYPDRIIRKPLFNRAFKRDNLTTLQALEEQYGRRYSTISFHSHGKK